ncbi:MAG: RNase H family protein [Candidatus Hodarchaeales archaeon]
MRISWVRAHSGNTFNEMADKLAQKGSRQSHKKVCRQSKGTIDK